jgi:hypothetical protein
MPCLYTRDETHRRIAEIGSDAAGKVKAAVSSGQIQGTLANSRTAARGLVAKELQEIDRLVKRIIS